MEENTTGSTAPHAVKPTGQEKPSSADDFGPSIRSVYDRVWARYQSNTDILWRVIAFSLASEATLWVAVLSVNTSTTAQVLLGLGLLLLGLAGPQTVRFIEGIILIDRQLLDRFEKRLLPNDDDLWLNHGLRNADRAATHLASLAKLPDERAVFVKRRLAKNPDEQRLRHRLDQFLDLVGQPSLAWTAVIAFAGAVGFVVATGNEVPNLLVRLLLDIAALSLISSLWIISNGWHAQLLTLTGFLCGTAAWLATATIIAFSANKSLVALVAGMLAVVAGAGALLAGARARSRSASSRATVAVSDATNGVDE